MMLPQDYLGQYQYIINSITALEIQREEIRTRAGKITATLSGMPGGGGNSRKIEDNAIELAAIDTEIAKLAEELTRKTVGILKVINALPHSFERNVIEAIYINGCTEDEAAGRLGKSKETIRRAHKSGLTKIIVPDEAP